MKSAREDRHGRAFHGLARALLSNMVVGVSEGFTRRLEIKGTGYRAQASGKKLTINVGYSHPVELPVPAGLEVTTPSNTLIEVHGPDKELVGQFAAKVRRVRPPEPYKGKGIRYEGEYIQIKAGKAGA